LTLYALRRHDRSVADDSQPQAHDDTIASTQVRMATPAAAPPMRKPGGIPARVGRFEIDRRLGSGGMGVVYEGHDPALARKVAIKVLHEGVGALSRLLREAQALAQLTHENVVQVYEVDTSGDQVFVAMQFIEGRTLHAWLRERPRTWREIVDVFTGAGKGLAAAHGKGLVHRDFKPDNVLVGNDGIPRVLDFGLARAASESSLDSLPGTAPSALASSSGASHSLSASASASSPALLEDLTRTGAIMGTPAYMSPEQSLGSGVGPASDQFSFCVALYEALYDQRPFAGTSVTALLANLQAGKVQAPPPGHDVPPWLHAAVLRGLALEPTDRFPSMDALLTELSSYRTGSLRVGSKARAAFMAIAFLVLLGALGGHVIAVRFFDQVVTPETTLPASAVAIVILVAALLALRKELTRSGLNERIFGCLFVYVFYGPAMRFAAWRTGISLEQMMPLEILGGSLAGFYFAFGFDRRVLWPAFAFFGSALLCFAWPARTLELHALGHFAFFGYLCWVWYRDGLPGTQG
jgi:predicted Ser/Thr protein kinase